MITGAVIGGIFGIVFLIIMTRCCIQKYCDKTEVNINTSP
jgi:hypothetical protein